MRRRLRSDPVAWLVIEAGWKVVARDGSEVGRVDEVVGDTGKDIFNGLTISKGLLAKRRYVPAERVATITEGRVELDLDPEAIDKLGEYDQPPPSEEILP
jgi:hypothetical protein